MSYVPFKAVAIMRDFKVRLQNRISGITLIADLDANRFPVLKMTSSAGDDVWMRLRTDSDRSEADGHVDGLGMAQRVYTPHVAELWIEDAAAAAALWLTGTTYAVDDIVADDAGVKYVCIQISAGDAPASSPTYWTALVAPSVSYVAFVAQAVSEVSKIGSKTVLKEAEGVNAAANFTAVLALVVSSETVIRSDDIHPLTSQI